MHSLAEYLSAWQSFDWRHANCAHFALGFAAPRALAGVPMPDCAAGMRGTLRALGARSLRSAVTRRVGAEIPPALAQTGDIVMYRRTLGLCSGRHAALPDAHGAIIFLPMWEVHAAWRRAGRA
jgi:hypothetical protein